MSTAGERLVIAMAKKWVINPARPDTATDLIRAVELLAAEEASNTGAIDIPWSQVVAGDRVQGAKSGRWFTIERTTALSDGTVKAWAEGISNPVIHPGNDSKDLAHVRRSQTGLAVDMFTSVMWSGKDAPEVPQ